VILIQLCECGRKITINAESKQPQSRQCRGCARKMTYTVRPITFGGQRSHDVSVKVWAD
jgi:hypothetical protein